MPDISMVKYEATIGLSIAVPSSNAEMSGNDKTDARPVIAALGCIFFATQHIERATEMERSEFRG